MDRLEFLNKELGTNYKSLDDVNWLNVSRNIQLSENFIREFKDKVYWIEISYYQNLSENFIKEFQYSVKWNYISERQKLSEEFIREFHNIVNWDNISKYQKLSENFIKKFQNRVNWNNISAYQKLSENFIRKFKDKVYWIIISINQKLSENFIREFKDKIYWCYIVRFQKLSDDFIENFNITIDKDDWLYKPTEFKKKQIIDCGLYECHEDYFIAYKAIRSDRYSHYNFQYQYLPNQTYDAHCDCTNNVDSFGLSVWTYESAKDYDNSGLIVKVKVKYEDIGRLVHNSNKIRCFKIEVLE